MYITYLCNKYPSSKIQWLKNIFIISQFLWEENPGTAELHSLTGISKKATVKVLPGAVAVPRSGSGTWQEQQVVTEWMFKGICETPSENSQVYFKTGPLECSGVWHGMVRKIARAILVTCILNTRITWQNKSQIKCFLQVSFGEYNLSYFSYLFSKSLIRTTQHVQGDALHDWKRDKDTQFRESGSDLLLTSLTWLLVGCWLEGFRSSLDVVCHVGLSMGLFMTRQLFIRVSERGTRKRAKPNLRRAFPLLLPHCIH